MIGLKRGTIKLCDHEKEWEREALVKSFLGKTVDIRIDRPMGSRHPRHPEMIYPVNYGFIPNVYSGNGEELDVYLLGVDVPVRDPRSGSGAGYKIKKDVFVK